MSWSIILYAVNPVWDLAVILSLENGQVSCYQNEGRSSRFKTSLGWSCKDGVSRGIYVKLYSPLHRRLGILGNPRISSCLLTILQPSTRANFRGLGESDRKPCSRNDEAVSSELSHFNQPGHTSTDVHYTRSSLRQTIPPKLQSRRRSQGQGGL